MRQESDRSLYVKVAGELVYHFGFQVVALNQQVLSLTLVDKRQALAVVDLDFVNDDPLITPMTNGFVKTGARFRLSELMNCSSEEAVRLFPFAQV